MKPGYKTSEFWLTVFSAVIIGVGAVVDSGIFATDDKLAVALAGFLTILTSIYNLTRGYVKSRNVAPTVG